MTNPPLPPEGGREVPPRLLAALTFLWFLAVAGAHYWDFFTHK